MHGDGKSAFAWSAGDKDGERRGGGFPPAHTSGSAWRPSDDDGGRRARGIHLASASASSARDKDGERRGGGFQPAQHGGNASGSAWRPSNDDDGVRRARGIHLAQHRGSSSASAWRGSDGVGDATGGGRPPPQQDVSDRPGSSRGGMADSASLRVDRFIEMGFPAEKVRLALRQAGGGPHEEEAVYEWLVAHQEHGDGKSASAWSGHDKDGERLGGGFPPAHTSGSAWRPSDDGGQRARGIHLAQHRGCSSASAWRGSDGVGDATGGARPPPQQDVSDRPGSSRASMADSTSLRVDRFIEMGFPAEKVRLALRHAGGGPHEEEAVCEWLVAHQETDVEESRSSDIEGFSSASEGVDMGDFDDKGLGAELTERDKKFLHLVEMGFAVDEVSSAIDISGEHESVEVLADAIYAAQIAKRGGSHGGNFADVELSADEAIGNSGGVKRKFLAAPLGHERGPHNKHLGQADRAFGSEPMVGSDLPNGSTSISKISDIAEGPPYFYFEDVPSALQRARYEFPFLRDVEPEIADSKYFCAAARKTSYIHNLPSVERFQIEPIQPRTIHEALPQTREFWPPWDTRTQLNCFRKMTAPATVLKKLRSALTKCDDNPINRKKILDECKDWNLIWVGLKTVAALDPGEVEMVLGLPRYHTRGLSMTDRYQRLGNSVQVDTVAFHFSVLKAMFPAGIRVLSLFSGIGGAEVALDRLGIPLKVVVSVEVCERNQNILRTWWEQSKQTGDLIPVDGIQKLEGNYLETLVRRYGGFDLIVGGRLEQSSQFCHCSRILKRMKEIMRGM